MVGVEGTPLRNSLEVKEKQYFIDLQGFKCALEVKGMADVVSRSFFSTWSLLQLQEGNICSGFRTPRKMLQKAADSASERITDGPEGPGHKKNWINLRGAVLGRVSGLQGPTIPLQWALGLPELG